MTFGGLFIDALARYRKEKEKEERERGKKRNELQEAI